ncbi:MAG TPA: hypothetical protein VGN48_11650 [Pedococcus sp.]|nr:hypothetical protein [Pedococcus sp.]
MDRVFTLDAADGIPDGELRPPMQPWWGTFRGAKLGLMTAAHGPVPGHTDPVVVSRLGRVSALISCLGHDDIASLAGVDPGRGLGFLSEELKTLVWGEDNVRVDDRPVAATTLTHRSLEFSAGADFITYPFLLVRLSGGGSPWPPLRTVPAPRTALTWAGN